MSFPQTYNNKIELLETKLKGERLTYESLKTLISEKIYSQGLKVENEDRSEISFSIKNNVFFYSFSARIESHKNNNDFDILYEIEMNKVIQIILTGIVLFALISFLSVKYFLIISGIFTLLFYQINLMMNIFSVEKIIKDAVGENRYNFNSKEVLSEEQLQWMNDENRCSGCGEILDITDVFCPECGLRIKKGKPYKPYNLSKYDDREVNYHYKKKD